MITQSTITMMKPEHCLYEPCSVCADMTILRFKDESTGFKVGHCCLSFLVAADAVMTQVPGVRRSIGNEVPNN